MKPRGPRRFAPGRDPARRPGFTLIEIVMVVALFAIASTMVVINFISASENRDLRTSEDLLRASIRRARFIAAADRVVTRLYFDGESGELVIATESGPRDRIELGPDFAEDGSGSVRFYLIAPARGLAPVNQADDELIDALDVRFGPDRSSSPYVVELDDGYNPPERFVFDPFSSLVVERSAL